MREDLAAFFFIVELCIGNLVFISSEPLTYSTAASFARPDRVGCPLMIRGEMHVSHCHDDILMSHQLLDSPQVDACHN